MLRAHASQIVQCSSRHTTPVLELHLIEHLQRQFTVAKSHQRNTSIQSDALKTDVSRGDTADHLLPRQTGSQFGRDDVERQIVAHVDDDGGARLGGLTALAVVGAVVYWFTHRDLNMRIALLWLAGWLGFILVAQVQFMRTSGGTQGVGRSTTRAVVSSSVWIFVLTAFITYVWNRIFVKQ